MNRKGEEKAVVIVAVENTQRKFGEVGEDEGYVLVYDPTDSLGVQPMLFTKAEITRAEARAWKNAEDVVDFSGDMSGF